jgi:putative transposase
MKNKKKPDKVIVPDWYDKIISQNIWLPNYDIPFNNVHNYKNFNIQHFENNNIDNKFSFKKNKIIDINDKIEKLEESKKKKLLKTKNEGSKKSLNTKFEKKKSNIDKVIITKKHYLNINKDQQEIISSWMNECTKVYNHCVSLFNYSSERFDLDYMKTKIRVFKDLYGNGNKPAPYDILTDEVKQFCSNVKSAFTNLRNHNIKFFKMKNKNTKNSQTILIPYKSVYENGFFKSILGDIYKFNKKFDVNNIKSDCKLTLDKRKKRFIFYSPQYTNIKTIQNKKEVCSIDPGEAIFLTYYGLESCGKIGEDIRKPILKQESKIRKLTRILKSGKNKDGNKLTNKRTLKRRINNCYTKIKNVVNELHKRSSSYLCKNYKKILIPEFKTQDMLKNKRNMNKRTVRLNKRVKFVLNMLSHYKFRQQLQYKCLEYGCELSTITEEYTSKCCTNCGHISEKYENRIKECHNCNFKINRDINGSRNILIKNIKSVIK